jgi:hypothetical protein
MPFSFKFKSSSVINTTGKLYLLLSLTIFYSLARAALARRSYHLSSSTAALTLHSHDHYPLLKSHIACTLAPLTFLWFCSWFCFGSFACLTGGFSFILYCLNIKIFTFVIPLTASEKSRSNFITISSECSSFCELPLLRLRLPPPIPPNRS